MSFINILGQNSNKAYILLSWPTQNFKNIIEMATHKALVLHKYGDIPVLQDTLRPVPNPGQLLVKVDGTTINPSDRLRLQGVYFPVQLPATMGLQATGHVVEANGENLQDWVGKRVSFTTAAGTWGEYTLANPHMAFVIDEDVELTSAASGVVNPLTVIGMIDKYNKTPGKKGIIHTAAASALGRMLNKYCKTLGIPLLNVVRKEEQAALLRSEGAEHVVVTKGDWEASYNEAIKAHGFNVFFDALGGGQVLQKLIAGLGANSWVHIYGYLEAKPVQIKVALDLSRGVFVTGYMVFTWYSTLTEEQKQKIRAQYSHLLKTDLKTTLFKTLKFSEIEQGLKYAVENTIEGKVTLVPN